MRIAVSTDNKNGLDSIVSPHFGRCPHFVLVDLNDAKAGEIREVDNPFYPNHEPGQVPAFVASLGANVMLTGGMGGRAIMFFREYGIEGVTGAYGTVRQSIERFMGGQLKGAAPCAESQEHGHGSIPPEGEYEKDDLGRLREEAEALHQQLDEAARRLNQFGQ